VGGGISGGAHFHGVADEARRSTLGAPLLSAWACMPASSTRVCACGVRQREPR
jgi:hypothetical protein